MKANPCPFALCHVFSHLQVDIVLLVNGVRMLINIIITNPTQADLVS
jgi:hypothetical protein